MNRAHKNSESPRPCSPIVMASRKADELLFLRDRLMEAGVKQPLVPFNEADSLLDYFNAVCIAEPKDPRLCPCLLFLDDSLLGGENGDIIEWVRRKPALRHLRVVVLSDREPVRAPAAAVQFVARFPAAATLAVMVASACGGQMS